MKSPKVLCSQLSSSWGADATKPIICFLFISPTERELSFSFLSVFEQILSSTLNMQCRFLGDLCGCGFGGGGAQNIHYILMENIHLLPCLFSICYLRMQ